MKKVFLPALLALAAYYALFGGEYSIFELYAARAEAKRERAELVEVRRQIDSLRAWADSLEADSATLERIARERYGLIREGETLYRFTDPDTASDTVGASR